MTLDNLIAFTLGIIIGLLILALVKYIVRGK